MAVFQRKDTDMTEGSIPRLLIVFALPLMIGREHIIHIIFSQQA